MVQFATELKKHPIPRPFDQKNITQEFRQYSLTLFLAFTFL